MYKLTEVLKVTVREAYIAATLRKILDNHMQRDIAELMPWNFSE